MTNDKGLFKSKICQLKPNNTYSWDGSETFSFLKTCIRLEYVPKHVWQVIVVQMLYLAVVGSEG